MTNTEIINKYSVYNHINTEEIKQNINKVLQVFEINEQKELQSINIKPVMNGKKVDITDEDGFTTVTSRTKQKKVINKYKDTSKLKAKGHVPFTTSSSSSSSIHSMNNNANLTDNTDESSTNSHKRKKYELTNFYSFQKREQKENVLLSLRKKFELDKEKILEI